MTRVLITGSRDWSDYKAVARALREVAETHSGPFVVVHGDARGADTLAAAYARVLGWSVEAHPAPWRDLGKRAGIVRNEHMVRLGADVCVAFIRNGSRGATHCAGLADDAGIPVVRYLDPPEPTP